MSHFMPYLMTMEGLVNQSTSEAATVPTNPTTGYNQNVMMQIDFSSIYLVLKIIHLHAYNYNSLIRTSFGLNK